MFGKKLMSALVVMSFLGGCKTVGGPAIKDAGVVSAEIPPHERYIEKIGKACSLHIPCAISAKAQAHVCFNNKEDCRGIIIDPDGDRWDRCVMFVMDGEIVLWCNPKKGGVPKELLWPL